MLRSVAIGTGWAKKQVEVPVEGMFDRVEATGAEDLKAAFVACANADVVDRLIGAAMLDDQVSAAVDGQWIELADIEAVFNAAGFVGEIELEGLPFQVYNRNQHGNVHRGGVRRRMVSPVNLELDYHLNGGEQAVASREARRFGNLRLG
jgi:hypothetical protein